MLMILMLAFLNLNGVLFKDQICCLIQKCFEGDLIPAFVNLNGVLFKDQICCLIPKCFEGDPNIPLDLDQTLIALVPKVVGSELLSHYKSINLHMVLFKVITKTIATKLRSWFMDSFGGQHLVTKNQLW
ncbi:hypothetical protein ES288_D11G343500v1 [Gossypium darwinii]|uniref:Uncharacterized protein n=1 Tax=Gossypium darwinii TaxID=34276 RepID=A0A5D2ARG1_GOSDA|nr:hypothetical protein ES288_D11G343500v1 [Gossypium darwinii]